jgi:hypothetical protein
MELVTVSVDEFGLLGCNPANDERPMFWRKILAPSSGSKSKGSKKPADKQYVTKFLIVSINRDLKWKEL